MKVTIWQINDNDDNKLGLLRTPDFLDILDVTLRAKNIYGENISSTVYIGDV
jgi:hypothetical protein